MTKSDVSVKVYVEKIDKLIASDNNPRKIDKKGYEALKKSLRDFPEMKQVREVVVDEGLQILGGHQRIYALKDLGYEDVTVKQVFGWTAKQKREFMIKDNTASGEWDSDVIANEWDVTELESWGLPSFKFGGPDGEKNNPDNTKSHKTYTCPNCQETFTLDQLTE